MITEDYVSFETAKLLKEKGFDDEYTNAFYDKSGILYFIDILSDFSEHTDNDTDIAASTLYVAMKWLREVHNINIDIVPIWNQKRFEYQVFVVTPENAKHYYIDDKLYLGYEQACEAAIKYCLENLI